MKEYHKAKIKIKRFSNFKLLNFILDRLQHYYKFMRAPVKCMRLYLTEHANKINEKQTNK